MDIRAKLEAELDEAEAKALDALARYKFQMFGYWAAIWVHLNRVGEFKRPSPFKALVKAARPLVTQTKLYVLGAYPGMAKPDYSTEDALIAEGAEVADDIDRGTY